MVQFNHETFESSLLSFPSYRGSKGSIVRLKIIDFMTYSHLEIKAGSNINLIMGPNGTGKSSIVCAICLGLAGKPKILGRALSLKEYIRHGQSSATIEIELFNPSSIFGTAPNWVIKRVITETNTGASSEWHCNGKKTRESEVENLMKKLNIQLDNLCQFLPQDRVQEFARMQPIELLESTEKAMSEAAGLITIHGQLKVLQEDIKNLDAVIKRHSENHRIETTHKNRLESDVQHYNERMEILQKIQEFEGKKLWLQYVRAMDEFTLIQDEYNTVSHRRKKEEKLIAPLKKEIDTLNQKLGEHRTKMNRLISQGHTAFDGIKRSIRDTADGTDEKVHGYQTDLDVAERNEKDRVKTLEDKKERLRSLKLEWDSLLLRGDCNDEVMYSQIRECDRKQMEFSQNIFGITGLDEQQQGEIRILEAKLRLKESEINNMKHFRKQRETYVNRHNPDVGNAVEFFFHPQNEGYLRETFVGTIHEPMIYHVSVNQLEYGHIAERHIPRSDQTAFFCENKDDVKTLIGEAKKHNWRISCIHHYMPQNFKKPKAAQLSKEMRGFGFERLLIDLIEAPDYYMSYICGNFKPQNIYIGNEQTENMISEIMERTELYTYYTKRHAVSIKKSYYSKNKNATTSYLNEATVFTENINAVEMDAINNEIQGLRRNIETLNDKIRGRMPDLAEWNSKRTEVEEQKKSLTRRIAHREQLSNKILTAEEAVKAIEGDKQDVNKLRDELQEKICKAKMRQLDATEMYVNNMTEVAERWIDVFVEKQTVKLLMKCVGVKQGQYDNAKRNANDFASEEKVLANKVKVASDAANKHKNDARAKTNQQNPHDDVSKKLIDEATVDNEIIKLKSRLQFHQVTDEKIIHTYNMHVKKIEELDAALDQANHELVSKKAEMEHLKVQWREPLEELIARINHNFGNFFRQMQCVGEICLDPGEDENNFSKYGIKIKVKFRSNEPLQELSGWKQSGGERAITTALYILALQELTKVPFRVIDEINQGMDARNEARFFSLLCTLANGEDTPQYFLLTPKLLPPVAYPDNVDFHIIMNGPKVSTAWKDAIPLKPLPYAYTYNKSPEPTSEESGSETSD